MTIRHLLFLSRLNLMRLLRKRQAHMRGQTRLRWVEDAHAARPGPIERTDTHDITIVQRKQHPSQRAPAPSTKGDNGMHRAPAMPNAGEMTTASHLPTPDAWLRIESPHTGHGTRP